MILSRINILWYKGILLMLFTCLYLSAQGQTDNFNNTVSAENKAAVDFRIPDKEKILDYKDDSRFQYEEIRPEGISLWMRIRYWFGELFNKIMDVTIRSGIPSVIVVIVIVLIVCLIVMKILGVNFRTILGKKTMDTPEIDIYAENVHKMDFDTLISNAIRNKDYRMAVRFLYLKNLKLLSDKEVIEWNPTKTNYSYQYEIKNNSLRYKFLEVTLIFDYIWYGEFPLDEQRFEETHLRMDNFNRMVANER